MTPLTQYTMRHYVHVSQDMANVGHKPAATVVGVFDNATQQAENVRYLQTANNSPHTLV